MDLEPQTDININTNTTTSTSSIEPETNPTLNLNETDATNTGSISPPSPIKSILKPKTVSLEPRDIKARAKSNTNTPRKVQFTVVDGEYGGRGKTEYTRCPSRKSHTRRPLPAGHFDTDSDSTATETDYTLNDNFSLLDTLNSQKFCQNSRLIKLVRRKKKKKDKERAWLAMISPTLESDKSKTMSRITFGNKSNKPNNLNINHNQNITTNNIQTQNKNNASKAMDHAMSNTMNNLLSMRAPPNKNKNKNKVTGNARFKSPYKSPSASMSRGRRALYKAQKAQQNRMNNASSQNKQNGRKVQNTPIVKGTPIVQKVTKMAAIRMASLDQINEDRDNGNDGDNDDDDDIMMNNNNGSVPPQDVINANKKKTSSSELTTSDNGKGKDEERKDNSHENSPKPTDNAHEDMDMMDPETLSDEMKTDEKNGNSLDIAYEDDEDDDLILDDLRNATTKSGATVSTTKPVLANINSLFMPKNKSDITNDDSGTNTTNSNSNSNSNRNNNTNSNPNTSETITDNANRQTQVTQVQNENDEAMQSKSPSEDIGCGPASCQQQLNFNLTSPMRTGSGSASSSQAVIPASPQMIQQSTSTSTSTSITTSKMSPMDFARGGREINLKNNRACTYLEQHSFSVGLGSSSSNALYSRSISTQTERIPCDIGIQVDMNADNMNDMTNDTPFVIMKDKPIIITTSTGSQFMRITDPNQIEKYQYQAIPVINDEKEPEPEHELQEDQDQDSEPVNHYGSVSESENDEDVVMNDEQEKDKSPSNELEVEVPEAVIVARSMIAAQKLAPQRELSPVIEEEDNNATNMMNEEIVDNGEDILSKSVETGTGTGTETETDTNTKTQTDIDAVSNATEINSNQSETEKSNETPPPEQRLQSLSLNIQHSENAVPIPVPVNDENFGINAQITNNNNNKSVTAQSPYKSPSLSMSRGRRALYKAQKAQQNRRNNASSQNKQNVQNTPIVKGTPMVQKVTKMAAIRMASLNQINENRDRDNGNDGDKWSTAKNRAHLKRKYDEAIADNLQDETSLNTELNPDDTELSKEPTPVKRRKVTKNTKSKRKKTTIEKRIKYQKKDLVWSVYDGIECPTIILGCFYDEKEKFYPTGYEMLWLNYIDNEGDRKGLCSVTEEPYTNIKSKITARQLEQRLEGQDFVDAAWNEIKKHRPDIHKKYKVSRRLRSTKPKKVKRKRRASVM